MSQEKNDTVPPSKEEPKTTECKGCNSCTCNRVFALPNGDGRWMFPGMTDGSYPLPH